MRFNNGQIGTTALIGFGLTIVMAAVGSFAASSSRTDGKVDGLNKEISVVGQRTTKVETESEQYRRDIENINKKLDVILERIKK